MTVHLNAMPQSRAQKLVLSRLLDFSFDHTEAQKLILTAGFLFLVVLARVLHQNPVTSYEIAVLWSLPSSVLGAVVGLLVVLLWLMFYSGERNISYVACYLFALFIIFLIGMPLVRSYFYMGAGDGLSHLGYARSLMRNDLDIFNPGFTYPGLHSFAIVIVKATSLQLERAMLASMVVFGTLYLSTMVVLLRLFLHSSSALPIAVSSAGLFLPLNHRGVHLIPHASSSLILFSPLVIYVVFRSFRRIDVVDVVLFCSVGVFSIFLHPRQFTSLMVLLGVTASYAFLRHRESRLLIVSITLLLVFQLWTFGKTAFQGRLLGTIYRLQSLVFSGHSIGAEKLSSQTQSGAYPSLADMIEFGLKLFGNDFVFAFFGGLLILAWLLARVPWVKPLITSVPSVEFFDKYTNSLIIGFFAVSGYFAVFLLIGEAWTRFQGFIMVPTTILGALVLDIFIQQGKSRRRIAIVVMFAILVPLAVFTFHPSPYIFSDSGHTTQDSFQGYETVYIHTDGQQLTGTRATVHRYEDAVFGIDHRMRDGIIQSRPDFSGVPQHFNDHDLQSYYDRPIYLSVTNGDRETFVKRGNGYWLSANDFSYLNQEFTVVYTNGDVTVYRI
ncbi:hypothetical protein IL252_04570 [Halomicrobium sp. IBSBa]|uniref:hypothetical protein n=1 Tax=Halomicrobium sp. IBSBa TaxID=2778916 RepID=UPI001ABF97B2|nr:hypothetical protein [Halomicrobium sp. IBSBa]MBO4247096.1 hypothetical protein [Halomicrobium sp. IBSBa]